MSEDAVPMLTFSLMNSEDGEVEISLDWADEFDLLDFTVQQSFLLQAIDAIDEVLEYVDEQLLLGEDDETSEESEGE
jgi:hypothetical protein